MCISEEMAALEPYSFEPERLRNVADDDSSEDNQMNEQLGSTFCFSCQRSRC